MSRMLVVALALCGAPATAQSADPMIRYARLTSVEPRCQRPSDSREILVCGARRADRWRVPFVGYAPGDPAGETVEGERKRLSSEPPRRCGNEAVLRNCGMVGVAVATRMTPGGLKVRQLAP